MLGQAAQCGGRTREILAADMVRLGPQPLRLKARSSMAAGDLRAPGAAVSNGESRQTPRSVDFWIFRRRNRPCRTDSLNDTECKSCFAPILLKNSKMAGLRNSRRYRSWRFQPLQGTTETIRASEVVLALIDVVPHVAVREAHGWP